MPPGRPSKLTPEITKQISDLLLAGNFAETVCDFVGIHKDTFYEWMRRGERAWQVDVDGGYVEFSDAIKKAIAQVEITTMNDVRRGVDNWQSRAWWLERRHPDKWGNRGKQTLEHTGAGGGPIEYQDAAKRIHSRLDSIASRVREGRDDSENSADTDGS